MEGMCFPGQGATEDHRGNCGSQRLRANCEKPDPERRHDTSKYIPDFIFQSVFFRVAIMAPWIPVTTTIVVVGTIVMGVAVLLKF